MSDKERVVKYITELGKILQETVQNNEAIEEILEKLREEGVGLQLNFMAVVSGRTVNFNLGQVMEPGAELKFEITDDDQEFLESLGIVYEGE